MLRETKYASGGVPKGVRITCDGDGAGLGPCTFRAPMEDRKPTAIPVARDEEGQPVNLPQFTDYAAVDVRISNTTQ